MTMTGTSCSQTIRQKSGMVSNMGPREHNNNNNNNKKMLMDPSIQRLLVPIKQTKVSKVSSFALDIRNWVPTKIIIEVFLLCFIID